MANTMALMLAMLGAVSAGVVLMFGAFNVHSTLDTIRGSMEQHDQLLKSGTLNQQVMSTGLASQRKDIDDLLARQRKLQASIEGSERLLLKVDAARRDATERLAHLERVLETVKHLERGQESAEKLLLKASSVQEDLKLQAQKLASSQEGSNAQIADVQRRADEMAAQQQEWRRQFDRQQAWQEKVEATMAQLEERQRGLQDSAANLSRAERVPGSSVTKQPSGAEPPVSNVQGPARLSTGAGGGGPGVTPKSDAGQRSSIGAQGAVGRLSTQKPRHADSAGAALSWTVPEYQVSWYRECGCTGMEIEAVTLLVGLVARIGPARVKSNRCEDTCLWAPATRAVLDQIEIQDETKLWNERGPGPGGMLVLVVHAAFAGVCGMPDGLQMMPRTDSISEPQRGLFRVSRSMAETDRVDKDSASHCNSDFDAVWVPAQFNMQSFAESGVSPKLLHVLHEGVDASLYNCSGTIPPRRRGSHPAAFGIERLDSFLAAETAGETFTFFSNFKWEDRKNWKRLLETFCATFPNMSTMVEREGGPIVNVSVRLIIKTKELPWGSDPDVDLDSLLLSMPAASSCSPRLLVVKSSLPTEQLPGLYRAVDAFVLPSHGEGWGLPLMEAMASGLPTIATGWGGQTEFMSDANSALLGYTMVGVPDSEDLKWAEPDMGDLAREMWGVLRHPDAWRERAERACSEVRERFSPEALATRTHELIAGLRRVVSE